MSAKTIAEMSRNSKGHLYFSVMRRVGDRAKFVDVRLSNKVKDEALLVEECWETCWAELARALPA